MVSPIQYLPTGMIDVSSTVNSILDQQNTQTNDLNSQISDYQTQISGLGQLQSSLSDFQTAAQTFTNLASPTDSVTLSNDITNFVNAYNSLQTISTSLNSGELSEDSTLANLQNTIQSTLNSSQSALNNSDYNGLAQIGITTQADGTLSIDTTTLNNAISSNLINVQQIFSNNGNGIADQLNNQLQDYLQPGGIISTDTYSLKQGLSNLQDSQLQTAYGQSLVSNNLTDQYTALNLYLNAAQVTSNLLTDQQALQQSMLTSQLSYPFLGGFKST